MIVMGLTWIFGILIVKVEALLPLAYIYTIMVAFQGLFIFLIFVIFSKQVREAYSKWWRIKVNESDFLSQYFKQKFSNVSIDLYSYTALSLNNNNINDDDNNDNNDDDNNNNNTEFQELQLGQNENG